MRILTIVAILGLFAVGLARPSKKEQEYIEVVDESDKELIRVARGDVDEDQEPEKKSQNGKKRSIEVLDKRSRRAAEEDAFFQALLTRAAGERSEKRRSFDDGADNTGYIIRDDWKGDSKISDADRQELENLFNAITSPDEDGEEKVEETRSLKPGMDGKVQRFIDWLMSQPPDKFTKSLSHILDVEATLTKMFYDGKNLMHQQQLQQGQQQQQQDVPGESLQQQQQQGQQQQQQDVPDSSKSATQSSQNCKTKCFTLKLGNTECKIICEPPKIEQPTPSPAYNFYPQQAGYGQQYPSATGQQAQALPCVPPNCPSSLMYPPAPQYTGQGYSALPPYPAPSQLIQPGIQSPVQEGCVGRSCDAKNLSQSDKPADAKPVKQDKPEAVPSLSKPGPAAAPVTFQTQGAQITVDPVQVSAEAQPQIPMSAVVPSQYPMPHLPQPYAVPPQIPSSYDSYAPVPAIQQSPPAAVPLPYYKPMPKDCDDYGLPRCRVFLDWPTDERNEIRASLRFKQNWDSDFQTPSSTKYRILKSEVEKAIKDVYSQVPSYSDVQVTGFSEEDLKVTVNFIISFNQPENGALHYLSQAISNNYLQSMPVYKNTLLREGLKHHHRPIVATAKELEALPKVKVESSHKHEDDVLTTESEAYQGCFRDRKPHRDLPKQYTKYEMTPDWCVARCKLAGYLFAGVQYGYLCFCGNRFGKYGHSDDAECNSLCFGDKTRTCGAFWHNSIFSIDGKKHSVAEFDKADDKEQSGSAETEDAQEPDVPDHTEVANNLMKAAEAALKAAKKLLPETPHEKSKRTPDEELQFQRETAIKALNDAESLMSSNSATAAAHEHKKKEKRDAEGDGRDLLVAYLSDVGGYDRNYRDVEDEDESGSSESKGNKEKFEYRRMVIDESGDGEFVERSKNKELLARRRRDVSLEPWDEKFDGPKKMASRAAPVEAVVKRHVIPLHLGDTEDDPSRLGAASGEADDLEEFGKIGESEESGDGWESGDSDDGGKADSGEEPNQYGFADESGASGESRQSNEGQGSGDETDRVESDETGFAGEARIVQPEENLDTQTRHRRELREEIEELQRTNERSKRQNALLDENKLKTIKEHVEQGAENILSLIVDIYQSRNSLQKLQQFVQQLKQDVMQRMNLPEEQRQQALNHLRETVKQTVVKKVNELAQSIRQEVQDYKQSHQAVSQQAKEASTAILDIPVFQDRVENLKSNIKKRAVEIEKEYKKAKRGTEELPSILKEHFKRNAPDLKGETPARLSRLHRDLNL